MQLATCIGVRSSIGNHYEALNSLKKAGSGSERYRDAHVLLLDNMEQLSGGMVHR